MRAGILLLSTCLLFSFAFAQDWTPREGVSASISLDYAGPDAPSLLRIETDPPLRGELTADIHHRGAYDFDTTLIRPVVRPGLHEFETVMLEPGDWGLWLRYGVGIETFQTYVRLPVTSEGQTIQRSTEFQGAMAADVPNWVQPMGFAVFGVLLLVSLVVTIRTLLWFKKRKLRLSTTTWL